MGSSDLPRRLATPLHYFHYLEIATHDELNSHVTTCLFLGLTVSDWRQVIPPLGRGTR